jgi:hypothetical protein
MQSIKFSKERRLNVKDEKILGEVTVNNRDMPWPVPGF